MSGDAPELGYRLVAVSPDSRLVAAVTDGPRKLVFLWSWKEDLRLGGLTSKVRGKQDSAVTPALRLT